MPTPPAKPRRRRGRPTRQSRLSHVHSQPDRKPSGSWIDSDVLPLRVAKIVGNRDERLENGAEIVQRLFRFARRLLSRQLSRAEREELRALAIAKRAPASVITRVLVAWRHGLGERDVRRMQRSLTKPDPGTGKPRPRVKKLIYR